MKLASERSINRSFYYANKRLENGEDSICRFKYNSDKHLIKRPESFDKSLIFKVNDYIDINSFKMIDIISDKFLKLFCKKYNDNNIPQNPYNMAKTDFENLMNKNEPVDIKLVDSEISFNYKSIFNNKLSNHRVFYLIDKLSKYKFNLIYEYRVKEEEIKGFTYRPLSNLNKEPIELFNYEILDEVKGKNDKVYERMYNLKFSSWFGLCFIENVKNMNIDWFEEEVYSLTNTEQMFYRFFILTENSKKPYCRIFSLWDIKEKMGIKSMDKNYIIQYVKNITKKLFDLKTFKSIEFNYDTLKISYK